MVKRTKQTHASSWRARATRFAPPALAAAALLAGWPSISHAQSGWKWFGTQAPAPVQAPKPANGFSKAVLRLMEQARQEALAGNYEAAIHSAERAHKISDAAAGVLGADPECSPELTKKFLTDMVALAGASRVPAAEIARTPATQTLPTQPSMQIASQAVPAPKSPAVLPQQPARTVASNIPPAPALAATKSAPVIKPQVPAADKISAPAQVQTPVAEELAAVDSPVVIEKAPESPSIPSSPIDLRRPHPSDRDIPSINEVSLYDGDQFAILGGDEESYPAASMAQLPEYPFEEAIANQAEEPSQSTSLALRRVTWSSRDSVESPEFEPEWSGIPFEPEPAPVTAGETQPQAETALIDSLPDEPAVAQEELAQAPAEVPQTPSPSPAESLYSLTFDFNDAPEVGPAEEPVTQTDVATTQAVAAPLPSTEMTPIQGPPAVASESVTKQPKPVAIRKFAVDNALMITNSPVETQASPSARTATSAAPRSVTTVQSPAAEEFESSFGPAVVPTEWSSASPEKHAPPKSSQPWTDSAWEPAKSSREAVQPEVAPAPEKPVETSSTNSGVKRTVGDIVQTSFVTSFPQENASAFAIDKTREGVVSVPEGQQTSAGVDSLLLIPRPSTVVRQTSTAIQLEAAHASAPQAESVATDTGLGGWSWGSLYSICGLTLFGLGVACFQLRSHSNDAV